MSAQYHKGEDVPTDVLADRLDELSNAITDGKDATSAEFTMRVPAEYDRDADLVLAEAARRLRMVSATLDKQLSMTVEELCHPDNLVTIGPKIIIKDDYTVEVVYS